MTGMQGTPEELQSDQRGSVRTDEIDRFGKLAITWWDPAGPMRALHEMNPLRTGWIDSRIPPSSRILDLGCGAGLASEAFAALGHTVLGLDAAPEAIAAARAHAEGTDLPVSYRTGAAEDLVAEGLRFPVISALEIIEHVADPKDFLRLLATLLEPGGRLFISTLNRTAASLAVAKFGAEYIARLLPIGTHDWNRFVTPVELAAYAKAAGLRLAATSGMSFGIRAREWRGTRDLSINYIAMLTV